ncbi:regulatory protein GemA [Shewanella avicenniae]|uniref:Regulatory protein GemA n=1 Tax=Shewanella avicenniae TaxID=2814294 RepID=A0ABX7QPF0_9GAMM|nr:regulatory protein GemA [Shewanella avicenniae]QSX32603.1 regulatory protein GemA [Shewanella avicenniae]
MTPKVEARKKQLIKLINVGKNTLQLDEPTYRAMLKDAVHKDSLRQMTLGELEQVNHLLQSKGFKPVSKANNNGSKRRFSKPSGQTKNPVIDKIVAVWISMANHGVVNDGSESALDAYVRRMTTNNIASVRWVTEQQADRVLESLKNWHRRVLVERIAQRGGISTTNPDTGRLYHYDAIVQLYEDFYMEDAQ